MSDGFSYTVPPNSQAALSGAASAIRPYAGTASNLPAERYSFIYRMGHDSVKYGGLIGFNRRDLISILPPPKTRYSRVTDSRDGFSHYIDPDLFSRSFRVYQRDRHNSILYAASGNLLCPELPVDDSSTILSLNGLKFGTIAKIITYEYIHYHAVFDAQFTLKDILVACEEQISSHVGVPLRHGTALYEAFLDVLFKRSITYGGRKWHLAELLQRLAEPYGSALRF